MSKQNNDEPMSINYITWLRNRRSEAHRASGAQSGVLVTSGQQPVTRRFNPISKYTRSTFEDSNREFDECRSLELYPELAATSEHVQQYSAQRSKYIRLIAVSVDESSTDDSICVEEKPSKQQLFPRSCNPNTKGNNGKSSTIHGSFEEFSCDLLSILDDASSSDVTIKCGTQVLKAHKNILSARSPVFKTMFSTSMRESAEGAVSIDDIDPAIVRDMLTFIYSNQVQDLSVPKACDLLNAAEKYELQALKSICVDFLMRSLSVANALWILQKADLYDKKLKSHTIKFISKKFSDLKVTEEWKAVQSNNPTLALEVLNAIVEQLT